jgi:cephalosporin hydroxylase
VIVVDNGSDDDQKLGPELVAQYGPEFRYLDVGHDAVPSPVGALNRAIAASRGRNLALMIDGAHVVTPGVIRFGLDGLNAYRPAVVTAQQWYVGPGQQGDVIDDGYDIDYEDRLFEAIDWPRNGYRLFEIGHFIGDRDWLDGVWESNCMFVPRSLLEQVGGYDESFSIPGGGYANLELYERLGSAPDVTIATILGEGSFHQLHGGTTTNQPDATERRARVFGYGREYAELRGRPYRQPAKAIHYVGSMPSSSARRTKPRRRTAQAFVTAAQVDGDGPPVDPVPVPDELRTEFVDAVWRSAPWRRASWLGHPIRSAPGDLLAYQEILSGVEPAWVIETGTGDGGRTLFLASVCELLGRGQVLSIDESLPDDLPSHPRIRYMKAHAHSRPAVARIREVVRDAGPIVVVLGSCTDAFKTSAQFERLEPFVARGSYVVVTDTIVNGRPVWPGFGPGPAEAVKRILSAHGDFVSDPQMEKYSSSFNPGGYLKRVS